MQTRKFDQVEVTCTDKDKTVIADVLQKNEKLLKVALVNTNIVITLKKQDNKKVYIGTLNNLEFTSTGETL